MTVRLKTTLGELLGAKAASKDDRASESGPPSPAGPAPETRAPLNEADRAAMRLLAEGRPAAKPAFGGLHALALAKLDLEGRPLAPAPDFSGYVPGLNNRSLYGAIAADLDHAFGVRISYGYSQDETAAFSGSGGPGGQIGFRAGQGRGYTIGERYLDQLLALAPAADPAAKAAIASFVIAHEFFHVLLRHPDLASHRGDRPHGFSVKDYGKYRPFLELQADYLAARYLRKKGLPLEPVAKMFEAGPFKASEDYPSGATRATGVRAANSDEFNVSMFQNEVLDCLTFLDELLR
jgi:hypothetical protein